MKLLVDLLLIINIIIPLIFIYVSSFKRKYVEIDHITLFSFGFLYYLVLPLFVGINGWFRDKLAMPLWYSIFDNISERNLIIYFSFIFLIYFSFIMGCYGAEIKKGKFLLRNEKIKNIYFSKSALNLFFILLTLMLIYFIVKLRMNFFKGYISDLNINGNYKGSFVAFSLVLFCYTIIYSIKKKNMDEEIGIEPNFFKNIFNKFYFLYIIAAVLVLSMGGRLYFMSGVVSLFVYKSVFYSKIKLKYFFIMLILFIFSMGFLGVFRQKTSGFQLADIGFNLFQEPIYTSFSLIAFVKAGDFELLNFPKFLISNIVNLVPTFILPNKLDYVLAPQDYGYTLYSPIGALSLFVSIMMNFGIIGSSIFLYCFGFMMSRMKYRYKSIISKTIYVMICGFLAFTFFRDGFDVSLIKNILEFSIIIPIVVIFISALISEVFRKK